MREEILKEIQEVTAGKSVLNIVDPGSGSGELARYIARNLPHAKVTGLELSPLPFWQSRLKTFLWGPKNVQFCQSDFFKYAYSDVDIVVTFLPEPVLHGLADILKKELPANAVLLSNAFRMPDDWTPYKVKKVQPLLNRNLYCYRVSPAQIYSRDN